jgi:MoxR-like ATPase
MKDTPMAPLEISQVSELAGSILDEVETAVIGKREALTMVLSGILAGGHVLLEDLISRERNSPRTFFLRT